MDASRLVYLHVYPPTFRLFFSVFFTVWLFLLSLNICIHPLCFRPRARNPLHRPPIRFYMCALARADLTFLWSPNSFLWWYWSSCSDSPSMKDMVLHLIPDSLALSTLQACLTRSALAPVRSGPDFSSSLTSHCQSIPRSCPVPPDGLHSIDCASCDGHRDDDPQNHVHQNLQGSQPHRPSLPSATCAIQSLIFRHLRPTDRAGPGPQSCSAWCAGRSGRNVGLSWGRPRSR